MGLAAISDLLARNVPTEIRRLDRFVLWRYEQTSQDRKPRKVPYTPSERRAATNRPATWSSFSSAMRALERRPDFFSGIGIVLGDDIMGIDLDHVIDADGELSPLAAAVVEEVPGYVERSPSGTGLHILTRAALPADRDQIKFKEIEFYDETSPRYLTLTGDVWAGRGALNEGDASDAVAYVYRRVRDSLQSAGRAGGEPQGGRPESGVSKRDGPELDDEALLQKIRTSRQGEKFSALYDRGDWRAIAYPSASEGVAALLVMLAFWTVKDEARMDRLFRGSALFDAAKWDRRQSGSTLGAIEIRRACEFCRDTYAPPKPGVEFPDLGARGAALSTVANFEAALAYHDIGISYDEIGKTFHYRFGGENPFSRDNNLNASMGQLVSLMEREGMPTRHLRQFVYTVADLNRFNPVQEWIQSRPWDGVDRLQALCDTIVARPGFPDDGKELLLYKWLLSAVAAACHDPADCPFMARGVLTLVGGQYIGKTRWISQLAPRRWVLTGHNLDPGNRDKVREAISHWVVELGELESTFKKDIGKLKAFLTQETDKFRIPYAADISEYPRRTVFTASVNRTDFLIDETGNSRFWTIPVADIHYDHDVDMQQLYAQVHLDWQAGRQWWLTREEDRWLARHNEAYEERDEVFDLVTGRIDWSSFERDRQDGFVEWLTPTDVLIRRCGIERPSKAQRNSCARLLRKLTGMEQGKRSHHGGAAYPIPARTVC